MPLQILNAGPDPEQIAVRVRDAIEKILPGAEVEVRSTAPGHFEIRVVSPAFEGRSRVQQQQMVYRAITPLMTGNDPPVHAIDKMHCIVP